ncbi:hypothetical protein Lgor_3205 [Fluoribacter gormanii]|uniref:Uncharacterized protein n=1 Tax=Fluoribacter gormanii TaxID=464 RepID=A0A377GIP3_9GAMM|nr:hypothetical protein Lgor_3205 [Fluoribacter gormanii]SIQ90707.1 hypothetical protein SAMN05421777_10484 [Fluoribacter gormanii]STO24687.1 Uncharacterised protein [Fluoribacter gormanii]
MIVDMIVMLIFLVPPINFSPHVVVVQFPGYCCVIPRIHYIVDEEKQAAYILRCNPDAASIFVDISSIEYFVELI